MQPQDPSLITPGQNPDPSPSPAPASTTESAAWSYQPDGATATASPAPSGQTVTWSASEFIAHDKPTGWYGLLAMGAALVAGTVYLLTKDWIAVVVVVIVSIIFGVGASRRPRVLTYKIDSTGLTVGDKHYGFAMFKSFSVEEGPIQAISLLSIKRFMPPLSVYYPLEQAEEIVDALSQYLPFEPHSSDPIDRLMHRIHF